MPEAGFAGKKNGALLDLAERAGFEIFVSMDKGLAYEQNLEGRRIAILILRATSNRLADLRPLVPEIVRSVILLRPGDLVRIGGPRVYIVISLTLAGPPLIAPSRSARTAPTPWSKYAPHSWFLPTAA